MPSGVPEGVPATAVMVYAPRDAAEVDTVLQVIAASYRFARGDDPQPPHPPIHTCR